MNEPFDVNKFALQFREELDRFVFVSLKPFSENIVQMEITKHDLETALLKSKPQMVQTVLDKDNYPQCFLCPRCARQLKLCAERTNYCPDCGQALAWSDEKY